MANFFTIVRPLKFSCPLPRKGPPGDALPSHGRTTPSPASAHSCRSRMCVRIIGRFQSAAFESSPMTSFWSETALSSIAHQISNGILYLVLCELLDIPVKAINIPKQFVLAYFKPGYSDENLPNPINKIEFFIDPTSGQAFSQQDVENYFKRISVPPTGIYFKPQKNKKVIQQLIEEFSKCFSDEKNLFKKDELLALARMLDE